MNRRPTTSLLITAGLLAASPVLASPTASKGMLLPLPGQKAESGGDIGSAMHAVAGTMGGIATRLNQQQTDTPVQTDQKAVTNQLDGMIAALQKQCSGSGGGMNPTKPMSKSTLAKGPGGIQDLHDPRAGEKQWGALKPKQREQILQSKTDGFPAGYESLLQSYYRRLSNEDNSAPPARA